MHAGVERDGRSGILAVVGAGIAISILAINLPSASLVAPSTVVGSGLLGDSEADEIYGPLAVGWVWRSPFSVRALSCAFGVVVIVIHAIRECGASGISEQYAYR